MARVSTNIGVPGLAILLALSSGPSAAATIGLQADPKSRCAGALRRAEQRLQRALRACAKADGQTTQLACGKTRRAKAVRAIVGAGCPAPSWAVKVKTARVAKDRLAFVWESPTNWARLLDRKNDPVASTVVVSDDRLANLLLLDVDVEAAAVVGYIEDVEQRGSGRSGPVTGRGDFPGGRSTDRSIDAIVDAALRVVERCQGGGTSMFADSGGFGQFMRDAARATQDMAKANRDSSGNDDDGAGEKGHALAWVVAEIVKNVVDDDGESKDPAPPTSEEVDDGQCTGNADGSCNDGEEDQEAEQSTEGSDDAEGSDGQQPAPEGGSPAPSTGDPGSDGEGGGCANARATMEDILAECESLNWQTQACRFVQQATNGCADESLINPGPEGDVPCTGEGMTQAEYFDLQCELRGRIAQPGPDGETTCVRAPSLDEKPILDRRGDLCSDPRANVTAEMCAEQDGVAPVLGENVPDPAPDPRIGITAPTLR